MPHKTERWKDLTILDMLVVTFAVAVGCSLAVAIRSASVPIQSADNASATAATDAATLLLGFVIGLQLAGPFTLGCQFLLRGRKRRLRITEILWFTPMVALFCLWATLALLAALNTSVGVVALLVIVFFTIAMVFVLMIAGGALLIVVLETFTGEARKSGLYWGDYLGCVSCLITTPFVFLAIAMVFGEIGL